MHTTGGHYTFVRVSRFLFHLSGIIYLMNPLHLPELKNRLVDHNGVFPVAPPDTILGNLLGKIRKKQKLKPEAQIKIPLAVCLSQSDRIRDNSNSFGFDDRFFSLHRHNGGFDSANLRRLTRLFAKN